LIGRSVLRAVRTYVSTYCPSEGRVARRFGIERPPEHTMLASQQTA
jgi:hypothetical protein